MGMTLIRASVDNAIIDALKELSLTSPENLKARMAAEVDDSIERLAREGKIRLLGNRDGEGQTIILNK